MFYASIGKDSDIKLKEFLREEHRIQFCARVDEVCPTTVLIDAPCIGATGRHTYVGKPIFIDLEPGDMF